MRGDHGQRRPAVDHRYGAPNRAHLPDAEFSRWVKPEQIAELIVFLLSDRGRAITGAVIPHSGRV